VSAARKKEEGRRKKEGRVSLVGAGPGDPGLITVAGLERIREADVIVYDRLISLRLLDHAKDGAELIDVGKTPYLVLPSPVRGRGTSAAGGLGEGGHDQTAINQLLIDKAREGKRVVRLKGGDPFVFGRGGEEAEALRAAGIDFEVIPGVTSAIAVPAYAGIPVTHRGLARSFAVITGHEEEGRRKEEEGEAPAGRGPSPDVLPTPAHGRGTSAAGGLGEGGSIISQPSSVISADTLVFLMGVKTLPETVRKLTEAGRAADTPVAVIRWGTTPEQQTVTGTLADIVDRVREAGLTSPAVTIVGEVVRLRETISWFEQRPLFGKRVLITRTRKQASTLAKLLADEGAIPIELPSIEIEPSADSSELRKRIDRAYRGDFDWLVFTSANAVDIFFEALWERCHDARSINAGVASIGPATSDALRHWGVYRDVQPDTRFVAEGLLEAFDEQFDLRGKRVLLPRAEGARDVLPAGLRAQGAEVDEVTLYRAAVPTDAPAEALELLRNGEIDIVTFTSSSTVRNLVAMLNGSIEALTPRSPLSRPSAEGGEGSGVRARPLIACIGPITAETARELGLRVDVEAAEHTVEGLVRALKEETRWAGS